MSLIVNMMPQSLSGEVNQDSEPNLSVNPANVQQIAATAFTPDPMGGANAPIYVSTDGGNTWILNSIVPGGNATSGTGDITLRFGGTTNELYTSDLRGDVQLRLNILRTSNFVDPTSMAVLVSRDNDDQPFVQATTVPIGPDAGKDRVYIGNNDLSLSGASGRTATIDLSLDAAAATPAFSTVRLETRPTSGQNGPQIRPAIHANGTVYAIYYGWRAASGNFDADTLVITSADVVVVRDDNWGMGASPFTALVDPGDSLAGIRVVQGISFPFHKIGGLGQQRTGGDLSIAVDPANSSTVYIAWADQQPGPTYTIHVRRSTDSGVTWSAIDLLTIASATNPALAINNQSRIAILYQQLTGTGASQRWETHLQRTADGNTWSDLLLATTPADQPVARGQPYLGDYVYLMAVGGDYYGVFCANNTPDPANFPNGVRYQRNANFTTHTLLDVDGTTPVAVSIDPFFFKIPALVVSGISPTSGPATGGTVVTVSGSGFTGVSAVAFGGTPAGSVTPDASTPDTTLTATSPAGSGTVDVTVTTPSGTSATGAADQFTYSAPLPVVTGISPTSGPATGGTVVTVSGSGFTGVSAVAFGGTPAGGVTPDASTPDTTLTATSPAGSGTVDVTVTTPSGTSATGAADQFTYV